MRKPKRQISTDKESNEDKKKYDFSPVSSEIEKNRSYINPSYKHSEIPPFESSIVKDMSER